MKVTDRRNLLAVLVVLLISVFAFSTTASARTVGAKGKPALAEPPVCVLHSLPSFIDQGEFAGHSTVGDVIEIECQPVFAEHLVEFAAHELQSRCNIYWYSGHSPAKPTERSAVLKGVELDDAGNAEVSFQAGPSCAAGEVLISAHLEEPPFTTVTAAYTVLAPRDTKPGVTVLGATNEAHQVEDDFDSSLYAIVEVEFPSVYAEEEVEIAAEQLFARCHIAPKLNWNIPFVGLVPGESVRLHLDNNGNAFVTIFAEESCASGPSLIEASLVKAPYTTYTTEFTVESPHETI
jgi:hypothetical protein